MNRISLGHLVLLIALSFLAGVAVACGILLPEGMEHFPDFWTAVCK